MRYLTFAVVYSVVYLGLGVALAGHPVARTTVANALLLGLALAFCGVIVWRRREWEGTQRLFWEAFAVGLAMWCVGQIGFTFGTLTGHRHWVEWHTMFSLCGGIGPTVALLALPHRGARKASAPAVGVELVSYAMLIGFIYAYFIMVPSVVPASGQVPQTTLLVLVQGQRFILFVGLAASLVFARGTAWQTPLARLTAGAGIGFVLRFLTSNAISADRYREGSVYDLAWIVPYVCYLWAALGAPASDAESDAVPARGWWETGLVSAVPVLAMPMIGFGILRVQSIGEAGDSFRLLLTTMGTVAGLGLLTLRVSMQSGELQRADARLRLLAAATEQTGDLILITRANGAFEHANDACVTALGYSREELARMTLPELLDDEFAPMVDRIGMEVRQKGIWRGTLTHRRKNGTTFPASSTAVALRNSEGRVTHFVGVQRDITEELKLRDQLVHSERLTAVGELIAGVAHEINNPLQTIIGCVELMLEERRSGGQEARDLELVRHEATRAGQIVRNLLAFIRRGSTERTAADLNQIARATALLREQHLRDRNVRLLLELHPGVLPVLVNREEIQQIVLNLVLNAEHAIGEHPGTIAIRTHAADQAHRLEVADDGPGIPPELRGRVFEPFFTTKDVGQGTGLGLSIALGIATAHGGRLELQDAGSGTRGAHFVLTLPAHAAVSPVPSVREAISAGDIRTNGRRRALLVEDEAPIRTLLSRLVARRDYEVVEAASCADARAALDRERFDLVLCDVRLNDGNGADVLRHVRTSQPELARRFVFVTGDVSALAGGGQEFAGTPALTKPFSAADLDRLLAGLAVPV